MLLTAIVFLTGCSIGQGRFQNPVFFYYLRDYSNSENQNSFFSEGALGGETREAGDHRNDLNYLMSIYLQGPLDENLRSPFPRGCRPMDIRLDHQTLYLVLSPAITELSEIELTIACTCISRTCMELTDVSTVQIEGRSLDGSVVVSRTISRDTLILENDFAQVPESTDKTQ
jgi:hypothetical protein